MAISSKKTVWYFAHYFRRAFGRTFAELSRTGKVFQTLWDAAQLQLLRKSHVLQIGTIAIELVKSGELKHPGIEKLIARIERSDRLIRRQEIQLAEFHGKKNKKGETSPGDSNPTDIYDNELEPV